MGNILAIIGRPNVGKSTFFNRLTQSRHAIVEETSGVTRDRHYGKADWNGVEFSVIDTGGYVVGSEDIFEEEIRKQVSLAIDEADAIVFMVDVKEGITGMDEDMANILLWSLDNDDTRRKTYKIGGPEQLSFRDIVVTMLDVMGIKRRLVPVSIPLIRGGTVFADYLSLNIPTNIFWLDYLATNRTCSLNTVPHIFNLLPSHFSKRLEYLNLND